MAPRRLHVRQSLGCLVRSKATMSGAEGCSADRDSQPSKWRPPGIGGTERVGLSRRELLSRASMSKARETPAELVRLPSDCERAPARPHAVVVPAVAFVVGPLRHNRGLATGRRRREAPRTTQGSRSSCPSRSPNPMQPSPGGTSRLDPAVHGPLAPSTHGAQVRHGAASPARAENGHQPSPAACELPSWA